MGRRVVRGIVAAVGCLMLVTSCAQYRDGAAAGSQHGDPAVWELKNSAAVDASTTTLVLLVTRKACSSGVTGTVLRPMVTYEPDRIVVQADVEPLSDLSDGMIYTCQGNPQVEVRLKLSEPVGDRELVDGMCLLGLEPQLLVCDDPVRWSP